MAVSINARALMLSLALFIAFLLGWHLWVALQQGPAVDMDPEYAKLMGIQAKGGSAMPGPLTVGESIWSHITNPFYDKGPNDKGIGIQLAYSIGRVLAGFILAALVAIPIGFMIGMSPIFRKAIDPFVQILKPVSPLAWMPLALYTIKDSGMSSIFVIFICSIWPMLINT
ncbi:MAG: nitrate ABC transporter, permease protein, partial [Alphaproteobacteria bacterium]|nr:nitrate ABC transporter, permease protein [Alphaproteobacteria bacterium]